MLEIGAIVWGVRDVKRAVEFWSRALNYKLKYPMCDDFAILIPVEGTGFQLSINRVTSDKPRRHHMDLFSDNAKEDVKRLISLGAHKKEWNYEDGADYTVLVDPEGNPFCVIQR